MGPVARPIALSTALHNTRTGGDSHEIRTPKDCPSQSSLSRISSAHLDRIASDLTSPDRAVLRLVARVRLCSGAQLERLFWHEGNPNTCARQARRSLGQLAAWRILDRLPRSVGGRRAGSRGYIYSVGPSGARLLARENGVRVRRLSAPGDRYVAHTLAIAELVVQLQEADRAGALEVIEVQTEPECWRGFLGPFASRRILKADLFVRVGVGALEDRWFLECDMATEASGALLSKANRYAEHHRSGREQHEHGIYPRVLFVVPDARREQQIEGVFERLPAQARRLFTICQFNETITRLATEANS
jgi:hypothetical protein